MPESGEVKAQFSFRVINGECIDASQWPTPDEGALNSEDRALYFARKSAVTLYLQGADAAQIKRVTSLGAKQAYRLIRERCLAIHVDGQPYGWRALIPYLRIQSYKRRKKIQLDQFGAGGAGAMDTMLDAHPDLRLRFEKRIKAVPGGGKLVEIKRSVTRHCTWFLDELRSLGYEQRGEWPFNTSSTAYYSVRRYIDKILASDVKALANNAGGENLVRKLKTGDGSNRPVMRFMQRIEMDAHKLDGRFCVSIPDISGESKERIVYRLWVIVLVEVVSRAVIGYYFSLRKEVSSDDVMRAIKSALTKWHLRAVSFSKEPYVQGAGLLSTMGEDFVGLCWDETSVDGALAEVCTRVRGALKDAVGSVLLEPENSFSVKRGLDDRPYIETFFRNLAGNGFQRLSNTTGAKAADRKGRDPDTVAITSCFSYEYAEELLNVLIANYNAHPHKGIGRKTPLNYAKFLFEHSQQPMRHVEPDVVASLFSIRKKCRVRGGAKVGRAAFVEFYYAHYTNEMLQNRQDLVGTDIWVINHKEDDGRVALASTLDGMPLGILRASPPWHISPHSLSVRKAVRQAEARGQFLIPAGGDAIDTFINFVEHQPNNKLPIHPAYLESRRILTQAADQFVGESLLKAAQDRVRHSPSQDDYEWPVKSSNAPRTPPASSNNNLSAQTAILLRRMTSIRK